MSTGRVSLDELLARATGTAVAVQKVGRAHVREAVKVFDRRAAGLRFAQLYVKHGFDARAAYKEFLRTREGKRRYHSEYEEATSSRYNARIMLWLRQEGVQKYIRDTVQATADEARTELLMTVRSVAEVNQGMLMVTHHDLIEAYTITDHGTEGEGPKIRTGYAYKPLEKFTKAERMAVQSLVLSEDGRVLQVKLYPRDKLMAMHAEFNMLLSEKGGDDADWVRNFRNHMDQARKRAIDNGVARGKVVRLPGSAASDRNEL